MRQSNKEWKQSLYEYRDTLEKHTQLIQNRNYKEATKQFMTGLREYGISFFIYLIHKQLLQKLISITEKQATKKQNPNYHDNIIALYQLINVIEPDYKILVESSKNQNSEFFQQLFKIQYYKSQKSKEGAKYHNELTEQMKKREFKMKHYFKEYIKIAQSTNIHKTNQLIMDLLKINEDDDLESIYDEIALNWLRKKLDMCKNISNQICCKLSFIKDENIPFMENERMEFKRYTWPIQNKSIKFHLKKTIVGLLNSKGGIIYIGIHQDKYKVIWIDGISLQKQQFTKLVIFFSQIISQIKPSHKGFCQGNKSYTKVENKYIINDYISIQFLPMVTKEDLLQAYKDKSDDARDYIVKVFVKIGHPKHLYHVITDSSIDFYERKDRNVQKMPFSNAYNRIYQKLQSYDKAIKTEDNTIFARNAFHHDCLYKMDIDNDNKKID